MRLDRMINSTYEAAMMAQKRLLDKAISENKEQDMIDLTLIGVTLQVLMAHGLRRQDDLKLLADLTGVKLPE